MSARQKEMQKLRDAGYKYREIAEKLGVSMSAVHESIGHTGTRFYAIDEKNCIFPGLRDWMNKTRTSKTALTIKMYGYFASPYYARIRDKLNGKNELKKYEIDQLLRLTGMTYEELFYGSK